LVGVFYDDLSGSIPSVSESSDFFDSRGWDGGWRITDNGAKTLWTAQDGAGDLLFWTIPNVFIVRTSTMEIYAAELGMAPSQIDVVDVVSEIDDMD